MILGMDWLDDIGKMWVDWNKKTMRFKHAGKRITLRGVEDNGTHCAVMTNEKLQCSIQEGSVAQLVQLCASTDVSCAEGIPEPIIKLLDDCSDCFKTPKGLAPHRPFDHHIQMLPGVAPVMLNHTGTLLNRRMKLKNR